MRHGLVQPAVRVLPFHTPPLAFAQLPEEVAAKLDPFESYLGPYLEQVKKEKEEQLKLAK